MSNALAISKNISVIMYSVSSCTASEVDLPARKPNCDNFKIEVCFFLNKQ